MITILHGDHIDASRKALQKILEPVSDTEKRIIDGRDIDDNTLIQALESTSLFANTTHIIIEQLFGKIGKQPKRIQTICALLKNNSGRTIIIWEDKKISQNTLKQLGDSATSREFTLPVLIFKFLDSVRPNNAKMLLTLYSQLLESESPELIFAMLSKRIRLLIQIYDNSVPEELAPWQIQRLTTQSKSFTMEQLKNIYKKIYSVEVESRKGNTPFALSQQTELLIVSM